MAANVPRKPRGPTRILLAGVTVCVREIEATSRTRLTGAVSVWAGSIVGGHQNDKELRRVAEEMRAVEGERSAPPTSPSPAKASSAVSAPIDDRAAGLELAMDKRVLTID